MSRYYDECRHVDPTGADRECPCQDDAEPAYVPVDVKLGEPWVYLTWDHAWTLDASLAVRQDSRGRVMTRRLQLERWPYPSGSLLRVR